MLLLLKPISVNMMTTSGTLTGGMSHFSLRSKSNIFIIIFMKLQSEKQHLCITSSQKTF